MKDAATLQVRNPRTGQEDYEITPVLGEELTAMATRMRQAQPAWAAMGTEARGAQLNVLADLLESDGDAVLQALQIDTGRRTVAGIEVSGVIGMLRRWAQAAPALLAPTSAQSGSLPTVGIETAGIPRGLVGVISPWNFPLLLSFIDAVPALAAGCAVLIKPSEVTPRFIAPLRALIARVDGLCDVLALTEGAGPTGAGLIGEVDMICFTGSVATGRKVAVAAAEAFIPASLELGGKDPVIIFDDADIERAATAVLRSAAGATGQGCQSVERLYVQRGCEEAFISALVTAAEAVTLSQPDAATGQMGPFIFADQAKTVSRQIEDALTQGARLECGGPPDVREGGHWMAPTVLSGVTHDMRVMQEETFGPVMPVMSFETEEEAIALANDSLFGLSGAVFSADVERARRVARAMRGGAISINDAGLTAFVFDAPKDSFAYSGTGPSRSGTQAILRFLRNQSLLINSAPPIPIAAYSERG